MNSIRSRLLIWLIIPLSVIAALVSLETFYSAKRVSNDLNDRTLLAAMLTISEHVVSSNGTLLAESTLKMLTENLNDRYYYHIIGPSGAFVTGYSNYPRPHVDQKIEIGVPLFYDGIYRGEPVRVVRMQQVLSGRELNGLTTITTWQNVTQRASLTLNLFASSLVRLVTMVIAAAAIVWFAVAIGLRPLTRLQDAVSSRTPFELTPIKRAMPIELTGIVKAMNELFERVARSKKNRERFIGDAAHQLRNPISAIKVQAETALSSGKGKDRDRSLEQIKEVADTSSKMINQMLSGAAAHALDREQGKPVELNEIVDEVAKAAAPGAFDKEQEISLETPDNPITVIGHEVLLREAVANLVDNAVKHNPPATNIEIGLAKQNGNALVYVKDNGIDFDETEFLQHVQPFSTANSETAGSGLGLSIAKDVADSHNGYLSVERPEDGTGKKISIILPL